MYKHLSLLLALTVSAALLTACATTQAPPAPQPFNAVPLNASDFVPKADTVIMVLDASTSMNEKVDGVTKFDMAKQTLAKMNQTTPPLDYQAGLVAFGSGSCLDDQSAKVIYGLAPYQRAEMAGGLDSIECAGGYSPMARGVDAGKEKVSASSGSVAMIIVSDGKEIDSKKVIDSVTALKTHLGDRLCVYPIQVGDDPKGRVLMDQVAQTAGCGFAVNARDIQSPDAMADYVTQALLAPAPVVAAAAPAAMAPADTDGDGVTDDMDQCPNTPKGATVNAMGCWAYQGEVLFGFDQTEIKPEAYGILDEATMVLNNNPGLSVEIQGYTDSTGDEAYNMQLSQKRAESVMEYLVSRGIDPGRLSAKGYGPANPVAPNDTSEGRARNRRVEFRAP
jgi:OOP family OmpA-OmpF porin